MLSKDDTILSPDALAFSLGITDLAHNPRPFSPVMQVRRVHQFLVKKLPKTLDIVCYWLQFIPLNHKKKT